MSDFPSTIHFTNLCHSSNKDQEPSKEPSSSLDGSTGCGSLTSTLNSPSRNKNRIEIKGDNKKNLFSDMKTISQLQLEIGNLQQKMKLSDDSTTSTKNDITTATSTTEEEDEVVGEGIPIDDETIIQMKSEIFLFRKRNENLEHENKRIIQDLSMREREVKALVIRCDAQGQKLSGVREARVMAKEIEQRNGEIKRKDTTIESLNEELTRTNKEATKALEEIKDAEMLKCKEIISLENTIRNLERKNSSFDVEVAKLSAEITFKDIQLKESHSTIVSNANSKLVREEKLQSLNSQKLLLISSFDKLKIDHLKRIAALKLENDQLKTCSENKAIIFQENIAKLEQTKKIAAKKDETIKHQKEFIAEMQSELTEKEILMDITAQRKKELDDKLQQMYGLGAKHLQEMGKLKASYLQLQNLVKREKNNHQESLQKEITIRQGAEKTLKTMRSEFIALKKQPANYAELQKTNLLLEDKITRQDNYLKKKLQHDRRKNLSSNMISVKTSPNRQPLPSSSMLSVTTSPRR